MRQLFLSWEGRRKLLLMIPFFNARPRLGMLSNGAFFQCSTSRPTFFQFFCQKCWKKSWILKFCCFWTRFVTLTYLILALFEILLFLDTFCNTNVSDYRTGEFGLSAWTLSLLSYLEKSIYQNSRVKSRASSRASENCCGGRLFRVHSTLPAGSVQLRIQHLWVKTWKKCWT